MSFVTIILCDRELSGETRSYSP